MLDRILRLFGRSRRSAPDRRIGLTKVVSSNVELALPTSEFVELIERTLEHAPVLELSEYRALLKDVPPPTDDQIRRFAAFVSGAKSWYKHLPPFAPGAPFYFFIDPCAGLDRIWGSEGTVTFTQRNESTRFHYTWMTTEDYRARFGRLSFSCEAGSKLFLEVSVAPNEDDPVLNGLLDSNWSDPVVYPTRDRPFRVPNAVLEAGHVEVTAVVHSFAGSLWFWDNLVPMSAGDWGETGDVQTVARIRERCRAARGLLSGEADRRPIPSAPDPEVEDLLRPERDRIQMQMIAAMKRMRDLVYAAV